MKQRAWLVWMMAVLLVPSVMLSMSACGRKGAPRAPEENAPGPVQFLNARGEVGAVLLSWQAPAANVTGEIIKDLGSFAIQRRDVVGSQTSNFEDVGVVQVDEGTDMKKKAFTFRDTSPAAGRRYDYIVFAIKTDGLEGETNKSLRVTFRGETTTVEDVAGAIAGR